MSQPLVGSGAFVARRRTLALLALGAFFLAAHLPFITSTPGTIDSVNFWLGVRDFNVADHQPHPPGYPVFIALGKLSKAVLEPILPGDSAADTVRALAILSAIFGAIALAPLRQFFRTLELDDRRAVAAAALTVTCPLFWFTAARPMSDIPGLVAGVSAQALLVMAFRRHGHGMLAMGTLAAGVAIGFRSQNAWLTVPLLIWILVYWRPGWKPVVRAAGMLVLGLLLWAVPLVEVSGGPAEYLAALRSQGSDDLRGADMLATHPSADRLVLGLVQTFAYPWANTALAATTIVLSLLGVGTILRRPGTGAALLATAAVPYGLFHLFFQESTSTRYALPLIPAMAYLTVCGLQTLGGRAMPWLVAVLSVAGVLIAFPPVVAYARMGTPVYQAIDDVRTHAVGETVPPVIAMHHAVARMLRGQPVLLQTLSTAPKHEWLSLVTHWKQAPDTPVWFLGEAGRNDLALIDPRSRRLVRSYPWSFRRKFLMARVPTSQLDWYEMTPPGWMAAEGWSLSPEAAGVASEDGRGPGDRPIVAFVRRRDEAAVVMVGGRNLSGRIARVELSIDRKPIDTWNVEPDPAPFLRMWQLPAGTLKGPKGYLPLEIRVMPGDKGAHTPKVAVEQFDIQSAHSTVHGFDSGWYEQEYDGAAPRPWRWSGRSGNVRIHHAGRDLILRVVGEVPLKHLRDAPHLSVRAGDQQLARFAPHTTAVDFQVRVPVEALDRSDGLLTLEIDETFVPDYVMRNGDRRQLGLRVYQLELREATAH